MGKNLLFLLLMGWMVPLRVTASLEQNGISGSYMWTEERSSIRAYADSLRFAGECWLGIPGCTFGSPELPGKQSRILILKEDKTISLQTKGGLYPGVVNLGWWQQEGDTINVMKDGVVTRKFCLSHRGERLTEMVRTAEHRNEQDPAPFFMVILNKYYRKIK